jgi:hypothetical protein
MGTNSKGGSMRQRTWIAVIVVGILMAACGGDDEGADSTTTLASLVADGSDPSAPSPSQLAAASCSADGTISGAAVASFQDSPAGIAGGTGAEGAPPAYYQASDRDVVVAFRASDGSAPATLTVSSDAGAWASAPDTPLEVSPDGAGASASDVTLTGSEGDVVVSVTISCG